MERSGIAAGELGRYIANCNLGALVCFDHFDAGLEGFFEVGNMGDGENAGKVGGDRLSANV